MYSRNQLWQLKLNCIIKWENNTNFLLWYKFTGYVAEYVNNTKSSYWTKNESILQEISTWRDSNQGMTKRNLHEPMRTISNILKSVLNHLLRDILQSVLKGWSLDFICMNWIIEGFTLNLRNSESDTLERPRTDQIQSPGHGLTWTWPTKNF